MVPQLSVDGRFCHADLPRPAGCDRLKRPRGHRPREGAHIIHARLTNPFQSIRATAWLVVAAVLGSGAAAGGVFNDRFEAAIQGLDTTLDGQIDQVAVAGVIGPVQVVCYVKGPPRVARPPAVVSINPDDGQTAAELLHKPDAFHISPTPVSSELPEVVT